MAKIVSVADVSAEHFRANAAQLSGVSGLSPADKADFDKDPAKYAPQYGAFCSYGVANGVIASRGCGRIRSLQGQALPLRE